jgi:hypothetical protein
MRRRALRIQWFDSAAEAKELDLLLAAVFDWRSWRIGHAITRLWRPLVPSGAETAVERWKKLRAPKSS